MTFRKYLATNKDLETIQEALDIVWSDKLDFIFQKRKLIASTVVISYDSKYIYLWQPNLKLPPKYNLTTISHRLSIPDSYQQGWCAGLFSKKIKNKLPDAIKNASRLIVPRISGGLFTPFVSLQKTKNLKLNPYTTRESYLATIIHEFGHIYWEQHRLWWYSDKQENSSYLNLASHLYINPRTKPSAIRLYLPFQYSMGEVYAFCTEYTAGILLWPLHKKKMDKFNLDRLSKLTLVEAKKNLDHEDSTIEPNANPHDFASALGKIILTRYPRLWPKILTRRPSLAG